MHTDNFGTHEISHDGKTVWVNGAALLGRFSQNGIDVHIDGQCAGEGCKPGKTDRISWHNFKIEMLLHHRISVPNEYMPNFLKDEDPTSRVNTDGALFWKPLDADHEVTVYLMTYGKARVCLGDRGPGGCISNGYCYQDPAVALLAATLWDGTGDPIDGWHRNPFDGRRREGGDPKKEKARHDQ